SRPFGTVILLPLDSHVSLPGESGVGAKFEALLCLEHSLSDMELGGLLDFISERIQSLSLAIDRILLEYQMTNVSYRWEKTFDGIQNPIAIVDVDYRLLRSNRHFAQKWARKKCFESLAEKDSPCEGCPVPEALKKGEPFSGQITVGAKVYEVYSYPIRLQGEKVSTNVVNHYVDITQARELTSRMIQNEKMGAIGLLAGNIAHELNNPLTGIRALTQAIMSDVIQGSQLYADLSEVERAAQRSQVIIKNLLEFSTGKEGNKQKVELDELVEKTIPMLKTAMRSHRSEVNFYAKGVKVDVEPHLIQQVIFNLVNNACQAMKQAGVIRLKTTKLNSQWIELSVEDTGPGIPEEIQTRIFEPFFTTKIEGSGTGLGLSMSKTMIERFGGRIGLDSKVDEGARFWIQLPIVEE
ncbi:MAG: ATP-binding protein, partial [Pseudobdellovibrionaceae bacterium]